MHCAVPGAIGHFFYIQEDLIKAGIDSKAYLSKLFQMEIVHWQRFCKELLAWTRFLGEVVQRLPTALGFCDASGVGAVGVWIDPDGSRKNFVWRVQWPVDLVADLVTWENPAGGITNLDLELAALVLQESCFPLAWSHHAWQAPLTGSNNMPTVRCCFREASTVNPVMEGLLRVCAEMNSRDLLTSSVFCHPVPLNTMADDASCRFDFPDNNFLSFFRSKCRPSQSAGSWTLCCLLIEITSCVISVLRRRMSGLAIFPTTTLPSFTKNSDNSVPRCRSSIG